MLTTDTCADCVVQEVGTGGSAIGAVGLEVSVTFAGFKCRRVSPLRLGIELEDCDTSLRAKGTGSARDSGGMLCVSPLPHHCGVR